MEYEDLPVNPSHEQLCEILPRQRKYFIKRFIITFILYLVWTVIGFVVLPAVMPEQSFTSFVALPYVFLYILAGIFAGKALLCIQACRSLVHKKSLGISFILVALFGGLLVPFLIFFFLPASEKGYNKVLGFRTEK